MNTPPSKKMTEYLKLRSDFTDFEFFQGNSSERATEKQRFISDDVYAPQYIYPKLTNLPFQENVTELKSKLLEASFELDRAEQSPELVLQVGYIHSELARIALTEAARNMLVVGSSGAYETSSRAFNQRNIEAYGEFDYNLSLTMISTELRRAFTYIPTTRREQSMKDEFIRLLGHVGHEGKIEPEMLSSDELKILQKFIIHKYGVALNLVPDTNQDTRYDAEQCRTIVEAVLDIDGLSDKGWKAIINDESIVPATYPKQKVIYVPANISYTSDEIRRILVGHEIKTHAWRYENSQLTHNQILEEGTASSADIEEGLGILIECAISGTLDNPSLDRARDRYITAGLALGADGVKRDAREVYEILWRMLVMRENTEVDAKQMAYAHVENAFRGTSFTRKGVIYTKLKIYYEGLVKNADYFKERIHDLDVAFEVAFLGRYDHTSAAERSLFIKKESSI